MNCASRARTVSHAMCVHVHFVSPFHDLVLVARQLESLAALLQLDNRHVCQLDLVRRRKNRHFDEDGDNET